MAVPTIASGAFRKMLASSAEFGVDRATLIAKLELDQAVVDDPDGRLPVAKLHDAWDILLASAPRVDAAVFGAERYEPGDYGLVGFVAMTSATLDEALGHVIRYIGLWTDEPGFSRDGATVRAAYRQRFADRPGMRAATEASFTELVQGARMLSRTRTIPRAVRFEHPAPADTSAHRAFFGCDVQFRARANELELDASDLALPLPRADAQLGAFLRDAANRALARRDATAASPLDQVRGIVAEELVRGVPSLDTVARRMATSARTLRRRLEESGTSFRELLDSTRAELARNYVRDSRMPLAEVAFMLGFSEPSTFHRAFKRWTSVTPTAWRAKQGTLST